MRFFSTAIFFLFLSSVGYGQTGNIKGYLVDSVTKEIIPFADISLTGTQYKTQTDIDGFFQFKNVPAGKYTLTASYIGFYSQKQEIIVLNNKTLSVKFKLVQAVSGFQGEIQAYAEPLIDHSSGNNHNTKINSDSGKLEGLISSSEVNGLPIAGAVVNIIGTKFKTLSNASGVYEIDSVPPGKYTVEVSRLGKYTQRENIELKSFYSLWFYLKDSPFTDSIANEKIQQTLKNLKKDTILLQEGVLGSIF